MYSRYIWNQTKLESPFCRSQFDFGNNVRLLLSHARYAKVHDYFKKFDPAVNNILFFFATDRTLRIVGIVKIGITKMKLTLAKIAVG